MKKVLFQNTIVKNKRLILIVVVALAAAAALIWVGSRKESEQADERSQKIRAITSMIESYRRDLMDRTVADRSAKKKTPLDVEENTRKFIQRLQLEMLEAANDYLNDPQGYIQNLLNSERAPPYHKVYMIIGPEHLPMLRSMLQDRAYMDQWFNIMVTVGFMRAGEEGADILMDFITRYDAFDNPLDNIKKTRAPYYLGLTGDTRYQDILRSALTLEGAENLARNWINNPEYFGGEENTEIRETWLDYIISESALALSFFGDEEDKNKLINLYEDERAKRISGMIPYSPLFSDLANVLATMEFLETTGLDNIFYFFYGRSREDGKTIYDEYLTELCDKYDDIR